jgi:transcriptional regulator GlxA family with amidase domain
MNIFSKSFSSLSVSLLVLPECSMMSVACTLDPMRAANRIAGEVVFTWKILTIDGEPVNLTCGLPIAADAKFGETEVDDVLIVIAGFDSEIHAPKEVVSQIAKNASLNKTIGGVEAGSWLMARAGLLNGYQATTHWEDLEDFAGKFLKIEIVRNRYVIDGRYFTTGGASPTFDLMLHLIRSRRGILFAMQVASVFIYDETHTANDAQYPVSLGNLEYNEPIISSAIKLMESSLDEPISIKQIAEEVNTSIRRLEMLFSKNLDISPGKFYRHLRIQTSRRMITDTRLSIQQIAVRTGFGSSSAFSRAFKGHFGTSPTLVRN